MSYHKPNAYERRQARRKAKAREAYRIRMERKRIRDELEKMHREQLERDAYEHEGAITPLDTDTD